MTRVRFFDADGRLDAETDSSPGERLLDLAQNAGQPLEGTCEGQMSCSTCHVHVLRTEGAELPPPSEEEDDMLDFAYGVGKDSRLACQIFTSSELQLIDVRMPSGSVDMTRS